MAKDVITRFKLETTNYDSKIKSAAKGLSEYSKVATNAGKEFDKFTKSNVEAAKALGTTATSTTNVKDRVKELVGAYNEAAKAYNQLTKEQQQSDWAKALSGSLVQLQQRISETKQEMMEVGNTMDDLKSKSSGLFGEGRLTGMLQVTGGNLLAQGITKLGAEMADTIQQSIELARQGEGVRSAFERLNKPGLLDNLKEATHGTVSELDLMKQAVKFDNFKLPLDQMGTLLAFAQQQAKDTGQSVDYMVDSIVTGLGRKSLPILDNLGLSASEIRERMKESGDMTTAVADIIRDRMEAAGGYVETAADRAARAAADAANEMERLGREAQPFAEEWAKAWNEIKIGGMQLLTTVFGPLAESARQIRSILNGGGFKFKVGIPNLADGPAPSPTRQPGTDHKVQAPGGYVEVTDKNTGMVIGGRHFQNLQDANSINTWKKSLFKTGGGGGKNTTTTGIKDEFTDMEELVGLIPVAEQKVKDLQQQIRESWDEGEIEKLREDLKLAQAELDRLNGKAQKIDLNKMFPERGVSDGASQSYGEQMLQSIRLAMAQSIQDTDVQTLRTLLEAQIKNGIEGIEIPANSIIDQIFGEGSDIPDEYWQNLQDQINEKLKEMEIDPINIDFSTGKDKGNKDDKNDKNDGKDPVKALKDFNGDLSQVTGGIGNIANGIQQLGIELPQGIQDAVSVLTGISSIITGITSILGLILVAQNATAAASWTDAIIPFANGGIVPAFAHGGLIGRAAAGLMIPGNSMSGDRLRLPVDGGHGMIGVNSGELILNRAQQGNLASQLSDSGMQNIKLDAVITGEQIRLVLNNNGRRTGRGEYVQTKSGRV